MLTSDPTSDSSDTGASGKNNEEPNSENNGWGAFSENNARENDSPPCQQPVENDSDVTMTDKNENETVKSDENKTAKVGHIPIILITYFCFHLLPLLLGIPSKLEVKRFLSNNVYFSHARSANNQR